MEHLGAFGQAVMALFAKSRAGGEQQFGVSAGMRGVAGSTSFVRDDRMDTLHPFGRIVVTTGAEIAAAGAEKLFVFTLVGIVTAGTAIVEGGMNDFLSLTHAVVALLTKSSAVGSEFETALTARVGDAARLVTGATITACHRVVLQHSFNRPQRRVTAGGHTAVGSDSRQHRNGKQADGI